MILCPAPGTVIICSMISMISTRIGLPRGMGLMAANKCDGCDNGWENGHKYMMLYN